jgi:hypothetical protein
MDQSNRHINLQGGDLADLRKILRPDGTLNDVEIARRAWSACEIDDKSIFDEDARRLASAFQGEKADFFYVVRVCDLLTMMSPVTAYQFETTQNQIEKFQGASWFEINLDDCLMFNLPVTCAVIRPGVVGTTTFLGNATFLEKVRAC